MHDRVAVMMAMLAAALKLRDGSFAAPERSVLSARAARLSGDDPLRGVAALIPPGADLRDPARRAEAAELVMAALERAAQPVPPDLGRVDIHG